MSVITFINIDYFCLYFSYRRIVLYVSLSRWHVSPFPNFWASSVRSLEFSMIWSLISLFKSLVRPNVILSQLSSDAKPIKIVLCIFWFGAIARMLHVARVELVI